MGRLLSLNFGLNSLTAGVEVDLCDTPIGDPGLSIQGTIKRSGNYALKYKANGSTVASQLCKRNITTIVSGRTYFCRTYIYIVTLPESTKYANILNLTDDTLTHGLNCALQPDGTISIWDADLGSMGATTATLGTGSWIRVELSYVNSTGAIELKFGGTSVLTNTASSGVGMSKISVGAGGNNTQGEWYFADVAVNDEQGSYQNSWPGDSKIIYLRPNAAGESTQWTPSAGNNYACVNEIPPDEHTSYVGVTTLNYLDMYGMDSPGLGSGDVINVVEVGGRFARSSSASPGFKFRLIKTSGGTELLSAEITPITNQPTYKTNAPTGAMTSPIIAHRDPDGSAWTNTTIDSLQAGMKEVTDTNRTLYITALWVIVDYTPGATAKEFAGVAAMTSVTPNTAVLTIKRDLVGAASLTSVTPTASVLRIVRDLVGIAALTSNTSTANLLRVINLAGVAQLSTITSSPVLQIVRLLAGLAQMDTVTPTSVLTIARALAGLASLISVTPDTANLDVGVPPVLFAGTAAMQSVTPTNVLTIVRALAGLAPMQTITPTPAMIVKRDLSGAAAITSLTPNVTLTMVRTLAGIAVLDSITSIPSLTTMRALSGIASLTSVTSTPAIQIIRALSGMAQISSVTPDTVTLSIAGIILLAGIAAMQSITPDAHLQVVRALSGAAPITSVTPDIVNLLITKLILLAGVASIQSVTPSSVLTVARALSGIASLVSVTPNANLLRMINLSGLASLQSATPAVTLSISRMLAGIAEMVSTTPDINLTVLTAGVWREIRLLHLTSGTDLEVL